MLCENGSKTLHRFLDSPDYHGKIASTLFHEMPRITSTMENSSFYMLNEFTNRSGILQGLQGQRNDDGLRLILILLCLLLITLVFIIVILYWRYTITSSQPKTPQIILGDFLESKEAYVYLLVCYLVHKYDHLLSERWRVIDLLVRENKVSNDLDYRTNGLQVIRHVVTRCQKHTNIIIDII